MAALVLGAAVAAGLGPQCSLDPGACRFGDDPQMGSGVDLLRMDLAFRFVQMSAGDTYTGSLCDAGKWDGWARCAMKCPLRLELTAPPAAAGSMVCLADTSFAPYDPAAHLSAGHPLNAVPLGLAAAGTSMTDLARYGCSLNAFNGTAGRLAVALRGLCTDDRKAEMAKAGGAAGLILVNTAEAHAGVVENVERLRVLGSSAKAAGLPTVVAARHHGVSLLRALDAAGAGGPAVTGRLNVTCSGAAGLAYDNDTNFAGDPEAEAEAASCPFATLRGACAGKTADANRLCSACPMEVSHPSVANYSLCVANNDLLPRRARTLLQPKGMPAVVDDAVLIPPGELMNDGCKAGDFDGLENRTVFMQVPADCLAVEAVHHAEAAGVRGLFFFDFLPMCPTAASRGLLIEHVTRAVEGFSFDVSIPVHTIQSFPPAKPTPGACSTGGRGGLFSLPEDDPAAGPSREFLLQSRGRVPPPPPAPATPPAGPHYDFLKNLTALKGVNVTFGRANSTAYALPPLTAARGVLTDLNLTAPAAAAPVWDGRLDAADDAFEWTALPIALTAAAVVLLALLIGKLATSSKFKPPKGVQEAGPAIPLAVASMLLSISLLSIIAVTAFAMTHYSGQESFDDAVRNGKSAVDETFASAVNNTDSLATELRQQAIATVQARMASMVSTAVDKVTWAVDLYGRGDDSYARFASKFEPFASQSSPWSTALRPYIYMDKGFYAAHLTDPLDNVGSMYGAIQTDGRADDGARGDGVVGGVNATQNGFLYGFQRFVFMKYHRQFSPAPPTSFPRWKADPFKMLGAGVGDPLATVPKTRATGLSNTGSELFWHVSDRSRVTFDRVIFNTNSPSLSVFAPIIEGGWFVRDRIGVAEVRTRLTDIATLLQDFSGNLTAVVFDLDSYQLISTSDLPGGLDRFERVSYIEALSSFDPVDVFDRVDTLFTVHDKDHLRALGGALRQHNVSSAFIEAGGNLSMTFDQQAAWVSHRGDSIRETLQVSVPAGAAAAADASAQAYDVEMRGGGCGGCVADDADTGRPAMAFEGENALYVYTNLSVEAQQVRDTLTYDEDGQINGSTNSLYQEIIPNGNGSCVASTRQVTENGTATQCLLHPWIWAWPFTVTLRVKPGKAYSGALRDDTPELFHSAPEEPHAVRVYANGQVWVGRDFASGANSATVSRQRWCLSEPVPGGLPVGVWSTLTVVVENRAVYGEEEARSATKACAVYLDGAPLRRYPIEGSWRQGYELGPYVATPWRVGAGFHGAVDYVGVEAYALPAEAVEGLHRRLESAGPTPRIAHERVIPSRVWYADVSYVSLPGRRPADAALDAPLPAPQWGIAAMLPREDVMREVDRRDQVTRHNLAVKEDATDTRLRQRTGETILVLIVVGIAAILIFITFNGFITHPFQAVAMTMYEAATLSAEDVPEQPSFLSEINALQFALRVMVVNLKEYKSYLPQSVTMRACESSDDYASSGDASNSGRGSRGSKKKDGSGSDSHKRKQHSSGSSNVLAFGARMLDRTFSATHMSLVSKRGSLLAMNILSFHKIAELCSVPSLLAMHGAVVAAVMQNVAAQMGVTEAFSGDRFLCSFNASRAATSHRVAAPRAAWLVKQQLRDLKLSQFVTVGDSSVGKSPLNPLVTGSKRAAMGGVMLGGEDVCEKDVVVSEGGSAATASVPEMELLPEAFSTNAWAAGNSIEMTAAAVSFKGRIGNMGCDAMKKFTFVADGVVLANALERFAKRWGILDVVIDQEVRSQCQIELHVQWATAVKIPKLSADRFMVYMAKAPDMNPSSGNLTSEWMYDLENVEKNNPYSTWNKLVKAVCEGSWEEAQRLSLDVDNVDRECPLFMMMQEAMQKQEFATPVIDYH